MSLKLILFLLATAGLLGIALGYFLRFLVSMGKRGSIELRTRQMELQAQEKSKKIIDEAERKAFAIAEEAKQKAREQEAQNQKKEDRLIKKEELLDTRQLDLNKEGESLKEKIEEVRTIKEQNLALLEEKKKELEKVAGLSAEEAREILMQSAEKDYEEDVLVRLQKLEHSGKERIERRAKEILTTAIHRLGNAVSSDVLATSVTIPNDEMKGKIIGKEGRNIRAFERSAGVELIVDDTPGSVIISAFDPVRRQVARIALENLMIDGRIQPARIEEEVAKAKEDINKIIKEKGEQAVYECGIFNIQ
jgi:ribonuclease Y